MCLSSRDPRARGGRGAERRWEKAAAAWSLGGESQKTGIAFPNGEKLRVLATEGTRLSAPLLHDPESHSLERTQTPSRRDFLGPKAHSSSTHTRGSGLQRSRLRSQRTRGLASGAGLRTGGPGRGPPYGRCSSGPRLPAAPPRSSAPTPRSRRARPAGAARLPVAAGATNPQPLRRPPRTEAKKGGGSTPASQRLLTERSSDSVGPAGQAAPPRPRTPVFLRAAPWGGISTLYLLEAAGIPPSSHPALHLASLNRPGAKPWGCSGTATSQQFLPERLVHALP